MNYEIKVTKQFGRGLYTTKYHLNNSIVFQAELLVLNERDTELVNETDLKYYTFKYNDTQDCLVLGDGELFNHSDKPNVGYRLVSFENRKVMEFYTLRRIEIGEQLFIDYKADSQVDTNSYKVNLTE